MSHPRPAVDPDLEHQYDIEPWTTGAAETLQRYRDDSDRALPAFGDLVDLAYGDAPRQTLDIARPPGKAAPAQIFIHGGYWRGSSKDERRFPAPAWCERGVAWVPIEYRLAPAVRLDDIVDDVRRAVAWIHRQAERYGLDRQRLYVSGNSAGGHLTAMLLAEGWHEAYGVPRDVVKGGCAVSGVFDLEPLTHTAAMAPLGLDAATVARCSPLHHLPAPGTPLVLAWGGRESPAFKQQSARYADACRARGVAVTAFECAAADHFAVIGDFADPDSVLFRAMARQMGMKSA